LFLCVYLGSVLCEFINVSLCHILVLLAFVVLGLVSSVLSQEIGWEGRLQNDLRQLWHFYLPSIRRKGEEEDDVLCVEWDVRP